MSDNLDLFHSIIIYFRKISNRKEVAVIYRKFIAQVARKKVELRLSNADLARMIGRKKSTVDCCLSKNRPRPSIPVYQALAEVLNLKFKED